MRLRGTIAALLALYSEALWAARPVEYSSDEPATKGAAIAIGLGLALLWAFFGKSGPLRDFGESNNNLALVLLFVIPVVVGFLFR